MRSIGNFFLFFLVKARQFKEELKVRRLFYKNEAFSLCDQALCRYYLVQNPYKICSSFLKQKGEKEVHLYGETPLTTLEKIAKECDLGGEDYVIELGSGIGRGVFFLSSCFGCFVHGIEWIPHFVNQANQVKEKYGCQKVLFSCEDMLKSDLTKASVIYLYGTCLKDEAILTLLSSFKKLKKGTKVITVSYPLSDYTDAFVLKKKFSAPYPWGEAEIFIQESL